MARMTKILNALLFFSCAASLANEVFSENWSGKLYDENSQMQFNAALPLVAQFSFNDDDNVLDIGCGNGKITRVIAEKVSKGSVIGIDRAPEMIAFACEKYRDKENLEFLQCDACDLPFENQFNCAVSFSCLHWVKDLEKAVSKIARSLKSGGKLLILMELKNEYPLVKALSEVLTEHRLEIPWYFYTMQELQNWLTQEHFESIEFADYFQEFTFKNKAELKAWVESFPYGSELDAHEQMAMNNEIVERYLLYASSCENDLIRVVFPETIITATKCEFS
ncbi:methyltransferase domain-containing protein [Candidatus Dependentiae bacterium]|nr:methyltransferase domain-containing protein [Candidatus Dependentiae bacterium]